MADYVVTGGDRLVDAGPFGAELLVRAAPQAPLLIHDLVQPAHDGLIAARHEHDGLELAALADRLCSLGRRPSRGPLRGSCRPTAPFSANAGCCGVGRRRAMEPGRRPLRGHRRHRRPPSRRDHPTVTVQIIEVHPLP